MHRGINLNSITARAALLAAVVVAQAALHAPAFASS